MVRFWKVRNIGWPNANFEMRRSVPRSMPAPGASPVTSSTFSRAVRWPGRAGAGYSSAMIEPTRSPIPGSRLTSHVA